MESYVAFLKDIDLADLPQVGGKAANLGHLTGAGYRVPDGFCMKADAFDFHMRENGRTQKKMRFTMEDSGGFTIDVTGDVRTVIPLDLRSRGHSTLVNEALAEYRWGEKVAYGIAEYLHQAG